MLYHNNNHDGLTYEDVLEMGVVVIQRNHHHVLISYGTDHKVWLPLNDIQLTSYEDGSGHYHLCLSRILAKKKGIAL